MHQFDMQWRYETHIVLVAVFGGTAEVMLEGGPSAQDGV